MQTNGQLPLNKKFLKKKFNPKTFINFKNSLKISLSQDPWCLEKTFRWQQSSLESHKQRLIDNYRES